MVVASADPSASGASLIQIDWFHVCRISGTDWRARHLEDNFKAPQ